MCIGLNEMVHHALALEVFACEITQAIATNLSDKVGVESATSSPHGDVGCTTSRVEEHLAE
jgi:hypothetical protein